MKRLVIAITVVVLCAAAARVPGTGDADWRTLVPGTDFAEGEVVITLVESAMPPKAHLAMQMTQLGVPALDRALETWRPLEFRKLTPVPARFASDLGRQQGRTFLLRYTDPTDAREVARRLASNPIVQSADINRVGKFELYGVPTFFPDCGGTRFCEQWSFDNANDMVDIDAPEAWAIEMGDPNLVIGMFDEGTQLDHCVSPGQNWVLNSDLNYNFNAGEDVGISGPDNADLNGDDADMDGWIDNIVGVNADPGCSSDPFLDNTPADWQRLPLGRGECVLASSAGHGIATASVAAGRLSGSNVVGIASNCQVHYAKFNVGQYADDFRMAQAVYYLAAHARVVNMSFGTNTANPVSKFPQMWAAFTTVAQEPDPALDCLFIAATGNSGQTVQYIGFPASHPDVMAVGGITDQGLHWPSSQWTPGPGEPQVDVVAAATLVAVNQHNDPLEQFINPSEICDYLTNGFQEIDGFWSGTSFAAPHATGIAALIRTRFPELSQSEVRERIKRTAEFYWTHGTDDDYKYGAGKVNAYRALTEFGHITESTTWSSRSGQTPAIIVSGDIVVDPGVTLTIAPGTTVRVACEDEAHDSQHGLYPDKVEIIVRGSLEVAPEGNTVTIESYCDSPTNEDWAGIRVDETATTVTLEDCTIKDATNAVEIVADENSGDAVTLDNVTIDNCVSGVSSSDDVAVSSSTISNCEDNGIVVFEGTANVSNTEVYGCRDGILLWSTTGAQMNVIVSDCNSHNNNRAYKAYSSGATLTLQNSSARSSVYSGVVVQNGATAQILGCDININTQHGIRAVNASAQTLVDYCTIDNNGLNGINCESCNIEITRNTITDNNNGIRCTGGSAPFIHLGNQITDNQNGIKCENSSDPTLNGNIIVSNGTGVYVASGSEPYLGSGCIKCTGSCGGMNALYGNDVYDLNNQTAATIMAECNFWGSGSGPDPAKLYGSIDYTPWMKIGPSTLPPAEEPRDESIPTAFRLENPYPNPFNPMTTVPYEVPADGGYVTIHVYDAAGRLVRTLFDGPQSAGRYTVEWDGRDNAGVGVATGTYFARMQAQSYVQVRKLVLLK